MDAIALANKFVRKWVHVAPYGIRQGYPSGSVAITPETVDSIIDKFDRDPNPIAIDYEHDSVKPDAVGPIDCAGWIHGLDKRKDGLWAYAYLNPEAWSQVCSGKYLYNSPVIYVNKPDNDTAEIIPFTLGSVALTNQPFLRGQTPLIMKDNYMPDENKKDDTKEQPNDLVKMLSDKGIDAKAFTDSINELLDLQKKSGMDLGMFVKALTSRDKAVLNVLASDISVNEEPNKWLKKSEDKPDTKGVTVETLISRIDQLNKQVTELQGSVALSEKAAIQALVDSKIKDGFILDNQKDVAVHLFLTDPKTAEKVFACKVVQIGKHAGPDPKGQGTVPVDENRVRNFMSAGISRKDAIELVSKH
jgi:phage I-like protein